MAYSNMNKERKQLTEMHIEIHSLVDEVLYKALRCITFKHEFVFTQSSISRQHSLDPQLKQMSGLVNRPVSATATEDCVKLPCHGHCIHY